MVLTTLAVDQSDHRNKENGLEYSWLKSNWKVEQALRQRSQ